MNEQTGRVIDAMYREQIEVSYRFACLMRTGMGDGINHTETDTTGF